MNVKSLLRKRGRTRGKRHDEERERATGVKAAPRTRVANALEELEEHIDDCLTVAKLVDREGLAHVIKLLRQARNEVVWKLGQ